jgi:hypothetical protein
VKREGQLKEAQLQEVERLLAERRRELQQMEASVAKAKGGIAADLTVEKAEKAKCGDLNKEARSLQMRYCYLKGRSSLPTTEAGGSR